jgi:hypothetical protein
MKRSSVSEEAMNYSCPVVIVRASGVAADKRGAARMLTDLSTTAFFDGSVSLVVGAEIHCELFDDPQVVARVRPFARPNAAMQYWKVEIIPRSRWVSERPPARPPTLSQVLDDLQATVEQLDSNVSRHDAAIDIEQIRLELKRSRPDRTELSRRSPGSVPWADWKRSRLNSCRLLSSCSQSRTVLSN